MFTPYAAAKEVNAALKSNGIPKVIPPQMMYNYTKGRLNQGKKPFIEFNEQEGVVRESFDKWLHNYIDKQLALYVLEDKNESELDEVVEK